MGRSTKRRGKKQGKKQDLAQQLGEELGIDLVSWLEDLQRADQTFQQQMMMEIWSIAQAMDEIAPGFWSDYMHNRQKVIAQQLSLSRQQNQGKTAGRRSLKKRSPLQEAFQKDTLPKVTPEHQLTSLFSPALENALVRAQRPINWMAASPTMPERRLPVTEVFPPPANISIRDNAPPVPPPAPTPTLSAIADDKLSPLTIAYLPHLVHSPVVKHLPESLFSLEFVQRHPALTSVAIACWLTRRFLVATTVKGKTFFLLQHLDTVTLAPGDQIICLLGFVLTGIASVVQVQLVRSLRLYPGLEAKWVESAGALGDTGPNIEESTTNPTPSEVAICLTNFSDQPCPLSAGQPLCRLEFHCLSVPAAVPAVVPPATTAIPLNER